MQAQTLSVGGKTGLNSFVSLGSGVLTGDTEPKEGYLSNVAGSLSTRYTGKKHWGIEAALSYTVKNQSFVSIPFPYSFRTDFEVIDYYMLDLSAQYVITCGNAKQNKVLGRLSFFLGAGLSTGMAVSTHSYTYYDPGSIKPERKTDDPTTSFGLMVFLSQNTVYRLNKEFSFVFSTDLKTMPWQWNNTGRINGMSTGQLGLLYHMH